MTNYTPAQIAEAQNALDEIKEAVRNHPIFSPAEHIVLKLAAIGLDTMKTRGQQ
jgi:hypothetical protein